MVILLPGFSKILLGQNKPKTWEQVWDFLISKKSQLPAIRITEQPILLTKSKINRPGYSFPEIFAKNRQSNLVLVLLLVFKFPTKGQISTLHR